MQTSRFKGVFSKRRRHSTLGKSDGLDRNTITGFRDLFVEVGNLEEPSASLLRVAPQQVLEARKDSGDECPEVSWIPPTRTHSKPHKSFSGLSDAIEEFRFRPTRVLSRRKRSFFSNKHTHSESYPADAVSIASHPSAPWYCYNEEDFTALPVFPGSEPAPPGSIDLPGTSEPPEKLASGAAARAAVAAQNELLDALKHIRLTEPKVTRDSESGVGIEVRTHGEPTVDMGIPVVRKDPLAALPQELVGHVLSYLDSASLINAGLVSRAWYGSASSRLVWRDVFRKEFREVYDAAGVSAAVCVGLGKAQGGQDWKNMWRARSALEQRWKDGYAAAVYLEGHSDSVYCVQFDEEKILTGSRDRTVRIWDARSYECVKIIGLPCRNVSAAVHPLQLETIDEGHRPFATVFSPETKVEHAAVLPYLYHTGSILCLQYDNELMVTGSSDFTLIMWDVKADYKPIRRLRAHTAGVLDVCFDKNYIVSCSKDATVCIWDRRSGEFVRRLSGHRGPVNAVQLRGNLVVSASGDGIAKLWNIASGLCIKEFLSKDRGMACVEFSPDSRTILAGGNDQVIYQFDTNTGELVREMKGHEGLVRSLHLDSASGRLVSGSYDTSVKAYDLRTGDNVVNFTKWTSSWILSAKADYRRIVATSQDGRAVIMDFGYQLPGVDLLAA